MELGERQRRALDSIVETLCPSGEGWPTPAQLGVADAILAAVEAEAGERGCRELARLLSVWDSRALGLVNRCGRTRFSELEGADRERVLLRSADSHLVARRAVFTALRRAALLFYYTLDGGAGTSPVWDLIGYDGPLGRNPDAEHGQLTITEIPAGTGRLSVDVVIVGSGAGGGPAAAVLAASGLEVIVVESGEYHDDRDFDGAEAGALRDLYGGIPSATADQGVALLAGHGLGGGTVVNWSTSFRTPREVRDEWASFGNAIFNEPAYDDALEAVCERLGVNTDHNTPSPRDQKLKLGCERLGWHVAAMPRGVRGCVGGHECGYCCYGCRVGAKQSTVKTWLADAERAGAKLVTGTTVERVRIEAGSARGVIVRTRDGERVEIDARATVVAAGAINTAAILKRSGLINQHVGRNLWLHPVGGVFGVFDEELKPWEGVMQALYSDQFRDLDGRGYGVKLETGPLHPSLLAIAAPFHGARASSEHLRALPNTIAIGLLLRDRDGGEVKVGRDGRTSVHYRLSKRDTAHLRTGIAGASELLEAAGARSIYTAQTRAPVYVPGAGSRRRFLKAVDRAGYSPGRLGLLSFHIMGTARMGGSAAISACDPTGQTWEARDLYVFDGSSFPTASGVNPQISIQAIAYVGAQALSRRLVR